MKRPRGIFLCLLGITLGIAIAYLFQSRDSISDWLSERFAPPPPTASADTSQNAGELYTLPPPEPEYQVVPIIAERFTLEAGQGKAYFLTTVRNSEQFAIRWASSLPADLGVVASVLVKQSTDWRGLLNGSFCHELAVTRFDHSCKLPAETQGVEMSLVVIDSRTGRPTLSNYGAALLGSPRSLDQATQNNNAALALTQRQCVAHCP